jgi:hypothetical protein
MAVRYSQEVTGGEYFLNAAKLPRRNDILLADQVPGTRARYLLQGHVFRIMHGSQS